MDTRSTIAARLKQDMDKYLSTKEVTVLAAETPQMIAEKRRQARYTEAQMRKAENQTECHNAFYSPSV